MEITNTDYDNHRFRPTIESLALMKILRDDLKTAKLNFPEVAGLSFFGSRVLGLESKEPAMPSDLDLNIFYDGTAFINEENAFKIVNGRLTINKNAQIEHEQKKAVRQEATHKIRAYYLDKLSSLNLPSSQVTSEGKIPTVNLIDISEQATKNVLNDFKMEINRMTNWGKKELTDFRMSENTINLLSRFHLGIGNELYKNRLLILDELDAIPDGDRYFKTLMDLLNKFERTKPTDKRAGLEPIKLPTTIEEAKEYFRTFN